MADRYSHKIYIANGDSDNISVIDTTGARDKKEPHDIAVGQGPSVMAINSNTRMIYVANSDSHSVSVINGWTSKLAAGVRFKVSPANSGVIACGGKQYPTNVYIYVDKGTSCTGQSKNGFEFEDWVENQPSNPNSTMPAGDTSGNLIVNRYGTFTANYKPLPPVIPTEYLAPLYGIIVSSIIGLVYTQYCWLGQSKNATQTYGRVHRPNRQVG